MTGAGWHPTITEAVDALAPAIRSYQPDAARGERLDAAYGRYRTVVDALAEIPAVAP